jgi:hypothetical protein
MSRQVTRREVEEYLEKRFLGKYITFKHPLYPPVSGRCDGVAFWPRTGSRDEYEITLLMGEKKYSLSPEMLNECVTLIKKQDGNIS